MPLSAWWNAVRGFKRPWWWSSAVWLAILVPGLSVFAGLLSDFLMNTRWLGSNPIKEGEQLLGQLTIKYLVAALAVTPLRRLTGWNWVARDRRTFGLTAFFYAVTHFLWFVLLDIQLDGSELAKALTKRPYIVVGFMALLVMVPLALTSTKASIARLRKQWTVLHRLAYVVPILGVIHWWMSVKADISEPILYSVVLTLLLGWRFWHARRETSVHAVTPLAPPPAR
jgi:sulfoxide reductase heme-binding subunit YedZ